jgi:hypothetical protein
MKEKELNNIVTLSGFDEALVGFARRESLIVSVYDGDAIASLLVERDKMTIEQAVDYIADNILSVWAGEVTPIVYFSIEWESNEENKQDAV